eukprot:13306558-Alexandrium_andersonii.AAC.1
MRSPWRTRPLTRERRRPHTMRCFMVLPGPSLLMSARRLIGNSWAPSRSRRLATSSQRTAQP